MPIFEIVCLANSLKHGGRCIAGFKTDGSGWIRPVSHKIDGTLYEEHYTLSNGQEPKLFDILQIECTEARPKPHQPENWIINDRQWEIVGYPTVDQLNNLLKNEIKQASNRAMLFGNIFDRIEWNNLQTIPLDSSLCLIRPEEIRWKISTFEQRKFRVKFSLQNVQYDLGITDPVWQNVLAKLPDGEYSSDNVINRLDLEHFDAEKFLFTISLGEPLKPFNQEREYCFKLVAAVINPKNVRALLS